MELNEGFVAFCPTIQVILVSIIIDGLDLLYSLQKNRQSS